MRSRTRVDGVSHCNRIPEINITFFKTGHWLHGMGHDRGTSVQSGIADAVFQVTGKRYRDLPLRNHDLTWS